MLRTLIIVLLCAVIAVSAQSIMYPPCTELGRSIDEQVIDGPTVVNGNRRVDPVDPPTRVPKPPTNSGQNLSYSTITHDAYTHMGRPVMTTSTSNVRNNTNIGGGSRVLPQFPGKNGVCNPGLIPRIMMDMTHANDNLPAQDIIADELPYIHNREPKHPRTFTQRTVHSAEFGYEIPHKIETAGVAPSMRVTYHDWDEVRARTMGTAAMGIGMKRTGEKVAEPKLEKWADAPYAPWERHYKHVTQTTDNAENEQHGVGPVTMGAIRRPKAKVGISEVREDGISTSKHARGNTSGGVFRHYDESSVPVKSYAIPAIAPPAPDRATVMPEQQRDVQEEIVKNKRAPVVTTTAVKAPMKSNGQLDTKALADTIGMKHEAAKAMNTESTRANRREVGIFAAFKEFGRSITEAPDTAGDTIYVPPGGRASFTKQAMPAGTMAA